MSSVRGSAKLASDERFHAVREIRLQIGRLFLAEPTVRNGLVDPLRLGSYEVLNETRRRFPLLLCDLGERLVPERFAQLRLRHSQERGSGREDLEVAVATEPTRTAVSTMAEEQRIVVRVDSHLQLVSLLLREPTAGDGLVDTVLQRLLERVRQLRGLDAELRGGIVDDRLALLPGREDAGRGDRACRPESGDEEPRPAAPAANVSFSRLVMMGRGSPPTKSSLRSG